MDAEETTKIKKSNLKELEQERHDLTCLRVVHLEGLLEQALQVIDRYAHTAWVDEAFSLYMAETGDREFSLAFAGEMWKAEHGLTTKMFGYPRPPALAEDAVAGDLSYWIE